MKKNLHGLKSVELVGRHQHQTTHAMTFAATIYVDKTGNKYGAKDTDQRHTSAEARTVRGNPVVCAGTWFGSQMSFRPFKMAVANAAKEAATLSA